MIHKDGGEDEVRINKKIERKLKRVKVSLIKSEKLQEEGMYIYYPLVIVLEAALNTF
jgi:hypothetical protein